MSDLFGFLANTMVPTLIGAAAAGVGVAKAVSDARSTRKAQERVLEAERKAFKVAPEAYAERTEDLRDPKGSAEERAIVVSKLVHEGQAALQVGNLFDLYSKQIEKYQTETQARAGWSFIFAIVAMAAGLGFVFLGGIYILTTPDWAHVAAGTTLAAIGGAVSAFITKTFMDVHRLSLIQLNHYFRQPVLNSHILTAQRIADRIDDSSARLAGYQQILTNVVGLITDRDDSQSLPSEGIKPASVAKTKGPKSKKPAAGHASAQE